MNDIDRADIDYAQFLLITWGIGFNRSHLSLTIGTDQRHFNTAAELLCFVLGYVACFAKLTRSEV